MSTITEKQNWLIKTICNVAVDGMETIFLHNEFSFHLLFYGTKRDILEYLQLPSDQSFKPAWLRLS